MRVYELVLKTTDLRQLRDCAGLIFAYLFNGLRESSSMSLKADRVNFTTDALYARVSIWKGRRASEEHLLSVQRSKHIGSPIEVIER